MPPAAGGNDFPQTPTYGNIEDATRKGNNMTTTGYLFAANVVVWLGIGCYCLFLAKNGKQLATRLKRMEILAGERIERDPS
jgi:CcmD family protein